jgi:hypothetical protein
MKTFLFNRSLPLILLLVFSGSSLFAQSGDNSTPLTNAAVVKLVKAGFKEKTILTIIAARPVTFELTPDRMIDLKKSGVSEKIIIGMIARQEGSDLSDEVWSESDDSFFSGGASGEKSSAKPGNNSTDGGGLDIFGSSGGSKGSTKTRGGSGASSGDIMTTGTATVRILRPPTEAGGAPAKLEKTKSLTNDSIIELVEAGFSEGTIIRRIEQSPVAFDFAADKVAELRKRRVSEKVLAAMKTAMGIESSDETKPASPNVTPKQ